MEYSYDKSSPEALKASVLRSLADVVDTREGSFSDLLVGSWALQAYETYQLVNYILELAFPGDDSGDLIDMRADDFGIVRTPGACAEVRLVFSMRPGASPVIPEGTVAATADGLQFVTLSRVDASGGSTVSVMARAEQVGRGYNVQAGAVRYLVRSIPGVSGVSNPEPASGGADPESNAAFLARYKANLRRNVASGNQAYYEMRALEVSGVGRAVCIPVWAGGGTARVVVAGPDQEALDEAIVEAAREHLMAGRVIGCNLTVDTVTEVPVHVGATITLADGASMEDVSAELRQRLEQLLAGMTFGEAKLLRLSRVLALLLDCHGVEDYSALALNGAAANLSADMDQTLVVGDIVLTNGGDGA